MPRCELQLLLVFSFEQIGHCYVILLKTGIDWLVLNDQFGCLKSIF